MTFEFTLFFKNLLLKERKFTLGLRAEGVWGKRKRYLAEMRNDQGILDNVVQPANKMSFVRRKRGDKEN